MTTLSKNRIRGIAGNIAIAAVWCFFIFENIKGFVIAHKNHLFGGDLLLAALGQSIVVIFLLTRRHPHEISHSGIDWTVGFLGTFLALLLSPAQPLNISVGTALITIGLICNILSAFSLNRSLGIVAANRGIKTKGFYRYVRHPLYASEVIFCIGYLIANASLFNMVIVCVTLALLFIRLHREEEFLKKDPAYLHYMNTIRWRLLPFIY
jgi:protein-S-isoprenylcysteine O-methyltransferase Ste14